MPAKTIAMDDLIKLLDDDWPALEWEADRAWLWLTSDLAPHLKTWNGTPCACDQCNSRKAVRGAMKGLGFAYARNGHTLPSGSVSHWGHHCLKPTRFKRRSSKEAKGGESAPETEEAAMEDAALLALIGG